ncbi:MAG: trimethylamine methyltransferase family protein, partial [Phycisphaerae bacterium]|nr:trimethylamine methyltransferase family protein [Phycisphaerae bacterium]
MLLKFLSADDAGRIDAASRKILADVGVEIPHEETAGRLLEAGASRDPATGHVRIPSATIDASLSAAGKSFTIYGRDGDRPAHFGQGTRNYNSIAGEAHWIDEESDRRRPATLADVATAARVGDALDNINIVGAMADPQDVPVECRCVEVAATLLRNTAKPITFWFHDRRSARFVTEIFEAVAGGEDEAAKRPLGYPFLEPISPLRFPLDGIDLLYETARLNLPVPIGPMAQVGLSAPGTLAGTLAQENAEILAGVCITQAIRPGIAVCYGGIPHAFDMATTQMIFAGPEQCLMGAAMAQMGKLYGLPVYVNLGLTDSKTVDAQAGIEAGMSLL